METDHFVYKPRTTRSGTNSRAGPARRAASRPLPCLDGSPVACHRQYEADLAAYTAAKAASKPLYEALNGKIRAFNNDYRGRLVESWTIEWRDTRVQDEVVASTDPARILVGGNANFTGAVTNDKSQILVGGTLAVSGGSGGVDNIAYDATRMRRQPAPASTPVHAGVAAATTTWACPRYIWRFRPGSPTVRRWITRL
ncbi:hypothetical protein ACU4GD_05905 [Cupriavidus basilensis]